MGLKSILVLSFCLLVIIFSCKKLADVPAPPTSINNNNVYENDATAISVLTGMYAKMSQSADLSSAGITTISVFCGLSADEYELFSGASLAQQSYFQNSLSVSNGGYEFWNIIYPYIYTCNSAIEGISASSKLTQVVKEQLLGEALFMRAFFYFYLVNLFGDVPLATSTDWKINSILSRSRKEEVYKQIISDLKVSQGLLSKGYLDGTLLKNSLERVRPNAFAASALLSRVYLYLEDWANAEVEASKIINNSSLYNLTILSDVFLKASLNNKEAIWQLQPVNTGWNTEDAKIFNLATSPVGVSVSKPVYLSEALLTSFEPNDKRKLSVGWIGVYNDVTGIYHYPYKYKKASNGASVTEYLMVFRLAEQFLIRAEARAELNDIVGAQSDLNAIRERAGLSFIVTTNKKEMIDAIFKERQVELFSEWGHRWLDLKRMNRLDSVMAVICPMKGGVWNANFQFYPIPQLEIQRNINLEQNIGY